MKQKKNNFCDLSVPRGRFFFMIETECLYDKDEAVNFLDLRKLHLYIPI